MFEHLRTSMMVSLLPPTASARCARPEMPSHYVERPRANRSTRNLVWLERTEVGSVTVIFQTINVHNASTRCGLQSVGDTLAPPHPPPMPAQRDSRYQPSNPHTFFPMQPCARNISRRRGPRIRAWMPPRPSRGGAPRPQRATRCALLRRQPRRLAAPSPAPRPTPRPRPPTRPRDRRPCCDPACHRGRPSRPPCRYSAAPSSTCRRRARTCGQGGGTRCEAAGSGARHTLTSSLTTCSGRPRARRARR